MRTKPHLSGGGVVVKVLEKEDVENLYLRCSLMKFQVFGKAIPIGSIGLIVIFACIYHKQQPFMLVNIPYIYPMGHICFGKFTVLKFLFFFFVFFLNGNCFVSEQNLTNSRTVWGYKSWTGIQQMRWADMARMCVCVWKRGLHTTRRAP